MMVRSAWCDNIAITDPVQASRRLAELARVLAPLVQQPLAQPRPAAGPLLAAAHLLRALQSEAVPQTPALQQPGQRELRSGRLVVSFQG